MVKLKLKKVAIEQLRLNIALLPMKELKGNKDYTNCASNIELSYSLLVCEEDLTPRPRVKWVRIEGELKT